MARHTLIHRRQRMFPDNIPCGNIPDHFPLPHHRKPVVVGRTDQPDHITNGLARINADNVVRHIVPDLLLLHCLR